METNSCARMLYLMISSVIFSNVYGTIPHDFKKVAMINTENELENLKSSRNIVVVYYYKKEMARIRHFFKEYDKSAEYLAVYGVQVGVVDCSDTQKKQLPEKCTESQIQHNIYTYKSGEELLILDLETMFDVNSIMSNILQLVLLHEVPIIQTLKERDDLIDRNRGKKDVILTYQKAIGTYEHRIFMEVAYAYQDRYAFALTTEEGSAANLKDSKDIADSTLAVLWVLHCKEMAEKSTDECIDVKYRGKMDLPSLAKFLRALSLPPSIEVKTLSDGEIYLKEKLAVVCIVYDKESKHEAMEIVKKYKYDLHGTAGIQLADKSQIIETELINLLSHVKVPGIGVMLNNEDEPVFMTQPWSEKSIYNFLSETLFDKKGDYEAKDNKDDDTEIVEAGNTDAVRAKYDLPILQDVEIQDDKVADSVHKTTKIPMSLDNVKVLKDETYKSTIKDSKLLLIIYYLHFDAKSMAVLRLYGESANQLKDDKIQLASVNCYDWTDVCQKQNITRYPTIRFYQNGKYLEDYHGAFEVQALVNTVKLLHIESPIKLSTREEVGDFIQGKLPADLNQMTNTSVLGVFDKDHKSELNAFKTVVNEYQKSLVFGVTDSEIAKSIVKVKGPAIIIIRHNDQYKKDDGLTSNFTVENIKSFIQDKKIPTLPELTPLAFPEFYQRGKPLVILFIDETASIFTKETVAMLSKSGNFPQFIFCWMDINSNRNMGKNILREYKYDVRVPALSLVNNRKGDVFNFAGEEFTETAITNWLNDVSNENLQPSKVLQAGEWKAPGRNYNFLGTMDYENENGGRTLNLSTDIPDLDQETENEDKIEDKIEDMEARAELLGLGNSRLYKDRKSDESKISHSHKKDEL